MQHQCVFALGYDRLAKKPSDFTFPPPAVVSEANNLVGDMVREFPSAFTGLCLVNPRERAHAQEELERCVVKGPFQGLKFWIARRVSHPDVFALAEYCQATHIPWLVHCWNKVTGNLEEESTTTDVAILAQAFPKLSIVAAHLTGQGERGMLELAAYPNVCIDTSGGDAEAGLVEFAISVLGPERILFGTDYPIRGYASSLARVSAATEDEHILAKILGGNFKRIFGASPWRS